MPRTLLMFTMLIGGLLGTWSATSIAQEQKAKSVAELDSQAGSDSQAGVDSQVQLAREQKLAAYLSGAKFSGQFTVDGKEENLPKAETYTISKCEKLPDNSMYRLTTRIQYGKVDSEVSIDIKILWSGNTPVMTLDSLWIPGMGTFDSRVLIDGDRYAGTWQHGDVGGHMFGKILTGDATTDTTTKQ